MRTGTWNEEMCQEFGFSSELLPEIHACHEVIGEVNEKAAKKADWRKEHRLWPEDSMQHVELSAQE